ncbi:MAG: type IV-A pilus assembly ATPase PilB [Gammaproteobacteria bacterium]|nr:type IV-A pilus assembly ATPase PilB [Gammaproteobacteria bacterium]
MHNGLAERLVREGLLAPDVAEQAQLRAQREGKPLVYYLTDQRQVHARDLAMATAREFGVPVLDLQTIDIDRNVVELVDEELLIRYQLLPLFKRGNRLFVGIADPTQTMGLDQIKFHTGLSVEPIVVEADKLSQALEAALDAQSYVLKALADADLEQIEIGGADADAGGAELDVDDAPVVRFVNKILLDAVHKGASDIHFEPYENTYRVRMRIDGVLKEFAAPPLNLAPRVAARLKVMSRLDISERRLPQDGRTKMKLSRNRHIDFRVSTCPTLYGEKTVLRILDQAATRLSIDVLGLEEPQKELFLHTIHRPYGMVLVTGPTGSGKTVTMYTALSILNNSHINISTVEDPVEIFLPGINQVNVNPRIGLSFANTLRSFLRQDPDVIMVGEIRDQETAEIAIKAAQTGHMVFSTLHTNDAPQSLTRLLNMGIEPYNIVSAVSLVLAQRLVRRLCPHCKQPRSAPLEQLRAAGFSAQHIEHATLFYAVGCERCSDGYKGRVAIYQVMPVSDAMAQLIMAGGDALALDAQARAEGVLDLRQAGFVKAMRGITTLEEIARVTLE